MAATLTRLSKATLAALPEHVAHPGYDPTTVTAGIVHIGTGSFSLSHLGSYVNDVLANDPTWGIIAVSLRSPKTLAALNEQDNLYVLIEREQDVRKATVLGSVSQTLFAPDDPCGVAKAIGSAGIRLVTMTVSNAGYHLANPQGDLNLVAHDVVHDLHLPECETPKTIYWYLAKGLQARMDTGVPLTIMSLDNVENNSKSLKKALLQFIEATGNQALADWVVENVDFPVSTVDRITPEPTEEFRREADNFLGFSSEVTICTEGFKQLVVEKSRFAMPDWAEAGVLTVDDCEPFWQLKFFGLNTAHQVLAMPGLRLGLKHVHDAAEHPQLSRLLKLAHEEFALFLPGEKEHVEFYAAKIRRRFLDYSLGDTNERVQARGTEKASLRLLASVEHGLSASGKILKAPVFVVAVWLLNLSGKDEAGRDIKLGDMHAAKLQELHAEVVAWAGSEESDDEGLASILARIGEVVRDDRFVRVAGNKELVSQLSWSIREISRKGVEQAIVSLLGE